MLVNDRKHKHLSRIARNSFAVIATVVLALKIAAAQNPRPAVPPALPGTSAIRLPGLGGLSSFSNTIVTADRPGRPRRITIEQVKQSANRMASPLAYLSHLS